MARTQKTPNSKVLSNPTNQQSPKISNPVSTTLFEVEFLNPNTVRANESNWRKHSARQRAAYIAFRNKLPEEFRWLAAPIYNRRTGRLVDGHMRVDEAIKNKEDSVPFRVIDCDEPTEKLILQYFDSISPLAQTDKDALSSLIEYNKTTIGKLRDSQTKSLAQLSKDLLKAETGPLIKRTPDVYQPGRPKKPKPEKSTGFEPHPDDAVVEDTYINNEAKFSSSNSWELPDLLSHKLATEFPQCTYARSEDTITQYSYYCESVRPFPEVRTGGFLGFYTEDARFERVYSSGDMYAELLRSEAWTGVILPDFSTYTAWPFPLQLFNVYRSRWCGRLWQELGINCIPTIQYLGDATEDVVLRTLPSPCPVVSLQTRKYSGTKSHDFSELVDLLKLIYSILKPETVILYGNPIVEKYIKGFIPRKPKYVFLPEYNIARRRNRK
jgi:hypothetical protein